jgi:hypothetical protein
MMRTVAAFVAASLGASILLPAVCASAQSAEPLGSAGRRESATVLTPALRAGTALEWGQVVATSTPTDAPGTSDAANARPAQGRTSPGSSPFAIVPEEPPDRGSHRLAWASFITGAGLVGLSFALTDRANDAYDDYLVATNPADAGHLYDRTRHYDRLSAASLLTGEALVATAVWLRFIRPRPDARITLVAGPDRCAVALRF